MSAITGKKEREERREQFYASHPQGDSDEDSDVEMKEWENQQIRKGVTGAQLLSAQQESSLSHYMMQPFANSFADSNNANEPPPLTTSQLLEQAYSQTSLEVAKHIRKEKKKETTKSSGIKTPQEILKSLNEKLRSSREQNHKNFLGIERISEELKAVKIDLEESEQNGPVAAAKYRFYQEIKIYLEDLIECLNEKLPVISALEEKSMTVMGKYSKKLIERRRQDVRDQAKELTDTSKKVSHLTNQLSIREFICRSSNEKDTRRRGTSSTRSGKGRQANETPKGPREAKSSGETQRRNVE
jgi:GC-rich sequence DNA-binding factor